MFPTISQAFDFVQRNTVQVKDLTECLERNRTGTLGMYKHVLRRLLRSGITIQPCTEIESNKYLKLLFRTNDVELVQEVMDLMDMNTLNIDIPVTLLDGVSFEMFEYLFERCALHDRFVKRLFQVAIYTLRLDVVVPLLDKHVDTLKHVDCSERFMRFICETGASDVFRKYQTHFGLCVVKDHLMVAALLGHVQLFKELLHWMTSRDTDVVPVLEWVRAEILARGQTCLPMDDIMHHIDGIVRQHMVQAVLNQDLDALKHLVTIFGTSNASKGMLEALFENCELDEECQPRIVSLIFFLVTQCGHSMTRSAINHMVSPEGKFPDGFMDLFKEPEDLVRIIGTVHSCSFSLFQRIVDQFKKTREWFWDHLQSDLIHGFLTGCFRRHLHRFVSREEYHRGHQTMIDAARNGDCRRIRDLYFIHGFDVTPATIDALCFNGHWFLLTNMRGYPCDISRGLVHMFKKWSSIPDYELQKLLVAFAEVLPKVAKKEPELFLRFYRECEVAQVKIGSFRYMYPIGLRRLMAFGQPYQMQWEVEACFHEGRMKDALAVMCTPQVDMGKYLESRSFLTALSACLNHVGFLTNQKFIIWDLLNLETLMTEFMRYPNGLNAVKRLVAVDLELGYVLKVFNLVCDLKAVGIDELYCSRQQECIRDMWQRTTNFAAVQDHVNCIKEIQQNHDILPSRNAINKAAINGSFRVCEYLATEYQMYPNTLGFVQLVRASARFSDAERQRMSLANLIPAGSTMLEEHMSKFPDEEVISILREPWSNLSSSLDVVNEADDANNELDPTIQYELDTESECSACSPVYVSLVDIANEAAAQGNLQEVAELWNQGYHMDVDGIVAAVKNGHTHIVKWYCSKFW